jgi:serine/threonine protein kinase
VTIIDPSAQTAAEPGRDDAKRVTTLGKYRLDRILGEGGMGIVWAAFDPDLERPLAIKVLRVTDGGATLRTRLLREARAMARLKHPNILTVYEVGTDADRDFIAMELVEGQNLYDWLATRPPRDAIVDALLAAGRGLAAAHAAGLVHRDFKPHNVLRSADGHVYVSDFGLARGQIEEGPELVQGSVAVSAIGSSPRRDPVLDSPLTQTGVLIGTPAYMAPEQFVGKAPDPRSDQFAFCVTAWEALAGRRPFRGADLAELERAAGAGVANVEADLPATVRAVLTRGLDPAPDRRWPDMTSLLGALSVALDRAPRRISKRAIAIAGLGAAVVGGGIAIAVAVSSSSPSSSSLATCAPADRAFDIAWGPTHRDQIQRGGAADLGAVVLLDEIRRQWIDMYDDACRAPDETANKARIACLHRVRDDVRRVTSAWSTGGRADMGQLGQLTVAVATCDPDNVDIGFDPDLELRDLPVPPTPPTPPPPPPPP